MTPAENDLLTAQPVTVLVSGQGLAQPAVATPTVKPDVEAAAMEKVAARLGECASATGTTIRGGFLTAPSPQPYRDTYRYAVGGTVKMSGGNITVALE